MGIINLRAKLLFSCRRRGEGPGQDIWWSRNKYLSLPIKTKVCFSPLSSFKRVYSNAADKRRFSDSGSGSLFFAFKLSLGVE